MTNAMKKAVEQSNEVKMKNSLTSVNISTRTIFNPQKSRYKKGFVDNDGQWLIHPIYDDVDVFREGVCWVKNGERWGLINEYGESLIDPLYDHVREFNEGCGNVKLNGKWGVVDKAGNFIFYPQFDLIEPYHEGIAIVKVGSKYGFINVRRKCLISPIYDEVREFSEGYSNVKLDAYWGYIDDSGNYLVEPKFLFAYEFSFGKAWVILQDTIGKIDTHGNYQEERELDLQDYEDINDYYRDLYVHSDRCVGGYIDKVGNYIVRPKFEWAYDYNNGYARVNIDGKNGLINTKGAYIIEPGYVDLAGSDNSIDNILSMESKLSQNSSDYKIIRTVDGDQLVDAADNIILKSGNYSIDAISEDMAVIYDVDKYKYGFIDCMTGVILQPKYHHVGSFNDGIAFVLFDESQIEMGVI